MISRNVSMDDIMTLRDGIMPFLAEPFISKMCSTSSRPDSLVPVPFPCCSGWPKHHYWEPLLCAGHTFPLIALHRDECFFKVEGFGSDKDYYWANQSMCGRVKGSMFVSKQKLFSAFFFFKYGSILQTWTFAYCCSALFPSAYLLPLSHEYLLNTHMHACTLSHTLILRNNKSVSLWYGLSFRKWCILQGCKYCNHLVYFC